MLTKIKLKEFFNLKECQDFINQFSEKKNVIKKQITPIVDNDTVRYFVVLEYKT